MTRFINAVFAASVCISASVAAATQLNAEPPRANCDNDLMIVFDASGSMQQRTNEGLSRIEAARRAISDILPEATANRRVGLITYSGIVGKIAPKPCQGIVVAVQLQPNAAPAIAAALANTEPGGLTPLTAAVETAAVELNYQVQSGTIVLVTDGLENCKRSPCALARDLKEKSKDLVVHVIGYQFAILEPSQVSCLAEATGGIYVPAQTLDQLRQALRTVTGCLKTS